MRRLLLVLAALPALAAAQAPAPADPAAKPAATPAAPATQPAQAGERRPLILRLDEIDGPRMSIGPSAGERYDGQQLPTLGGDAKTPDYRMRANPYPHSSDNLQ